jgi:DNA-binding SARP family transcriptional activator/Tfp pilus assembly protein PilF
LSLDFGLLGPLEVRIGPRRIDVNGGRQRQVLAVLLLGAGRAVSFAELAAAVWDANPPATARRQVHTAVWQLRRTLARHGAADLLRSEPIGYRLCVDVGQVDLARFEAGLAGASRLVAAGKPREVAATLRSALSLWRGRAFDGLTGEILEREAGRLEQLRIAAVEDCIEAELAAGDGHDHVAELSALVAEHPLRERLAAALMLALYRDGRQAEALQVYRRVAEALAAELGVDPGADLQQRYVAILRGDPGPPAAQQAALRPVPAVPAQLPADVAGFAGRRPVLARLDELLAGGGDAWPIDGPASGPRTRSPAVVISAVSGTAGIGKTALAIHWAHRVADRFPDGQLYVNLRGFDPTAAPMDPGQALRGFLTALHVPAQDIPADPDAQAALYRSTIAGRRMLVVLDNARDSAQVRRLLPGASGCLVLVTSRNQLAGLVATDGARPIVLDLLPVDDARQVLVRRVGQHRIANEPEAVRQIIDACVRLPLALAIVAARAATNPHLSLQAIAAELADGHDRLDTLTSGDPCSDVRTVFSWSYRALSPDAARLFRLLGLHPGPDISTSAAASLSGVTRAQVRPALTELIRNNILMEPTAGRYTFHDLLRAYATDLAHTTEAEQQRQAAVLRALDHYVHSAHAAARLLNPHRDQITLPPPRPGVTPEDPADHERAMAWFTAEHLVLVAAVDYAASTGHDTHTWQLAWALTEFLHRQGQWHDQVTTGTAAVAAAHRAADPSTQAGAHRLLARAYVQLGRFDDGQLHLRRALDLYHEAGDGVGEAHTHNTLGWVWATQGRHADALHHAEEAFRLFRVTGHRPGQALALNGIGWLYAQVGEPEPALGACRQALALFQELDDRTGQAHTWDSLGYAHHELGEHSQAIACYQQALDLYRDLGNRSYEAVLLDHIGDTHHASGNTEAARDIWRQALAILGDLDHPGADKVRAKLG